MLEEGQICQESDVSAAAGCQESEELEALAGCRVLVAWACQGLEEWESAEYRSLELNGSGAAGR